MRSASAWAIVLALFTACDASGGRPEPLACTSDDDCGVGWCRQQTCVGDVLPAVRIDAPSAVRANELTTFSATISDPDAGDSVADLRWTVTPVAGGCAADLEAATQTGSQVLFWCPGSYRVELVATDQRGGEGAAEPRVVEVSASPSAPTVVAAPDVSVGHRCVGEPLVCELTPAGGVLQLSAVGTDPEGGLLTYAWVALPPDGAAATAAFAPTAGSPQPALSITTPGGAIAGDWRFRVRVRDDEGLYAQDFQIVHVENASPSVVQAPILAPHENRDGLYVAETVISPVATDPDGDPLTLSLSVEEPAGTGCTFQASLDEAGGTLVQLSCSDATKFIGEVERFVSLRAVDANGAVATLAVPFSATNEPPVVRLRTEPFNPMRLDHRVEPCGATQCFVADAWDAFEAVDPEGDPIGPVVLEPSARPGTQPNSFATALLSDAGVAGFELRTPIVFPQEFRLSNGITDFGLRARAADPWSDGISDVTLLIGNSPPQTTGAMPGGFIDHRYDALAKAYVVTAPLPAYADPDGDPVYLGGLTGDCRVVAGGPGAAIECTHAFDAVGGGALPLASFLGARTATVEASDDWNATTGSASFVIRNRGPTRACTDTVTTSACNCRCWNWDPTETECLSARWVFSQRATLAGPEDPDGDPLDVTILAPPAATVTSPSRCVGASCGIGVTVTGTTAGTYQFDVQATDGALGTGWASCHLTLSCASAGAACAY